MPIDHAGLAEELRTAERNVAGAPFIVERHPEFTWEDARLVARATDALRSAEGDVLVGYKLGWTSSAMREALGIAQPNWGTLWRSQWIEGPLEGSTLIHPKIEPELVYCDGDWALGLEIVDPRFPSFDFDHLDNTADNSSCARFAVGSFTSAVLDPSEVTIDFSFGGEHRSGVGADAMGSPAVAVEWLREQLATEGDALLPGHIVFTGGLAKPFDLSPGVYLSEAVELPDPVSLTVT